MPGRVNGGSQNTETPSETHQPKSGCSLSNHSSNGGGTSSSSNNGTSSNDSNNSGSNGSNSNSCDFYGDTNEFFQTEKIKLPKEMEIKSDSDHSSGYAATNKDWAKSPNVTEADEVFQIVHAWPTDAIMVEEMLASSSKPALILLLKNGCGRRNHRSRISSSSLSGHFDVCHYRRQACILHRGCKQNVPAWDPAELAKLVIW